MRLFLALNPPPELRERLGALADIAHARCGGRRMPDPSLHLTLAFLGEVEEPRAAELVEWVQDLAIEPGEWHLDGWGCFKRPGIVWVGGRQTDHGLARLQGRLWDELETRGFGRRPGGFTPHVTLLRRAASLDVNGLPAVDLTWSYERMALLHSIVDQRGAHYHSLAASQC